MFCYVRVGCRRYLKDDCLLVKEPELRLLSCSGYSPLGHRRKEKRKVVK